MAYTGGWVSPLPNTVEFNVSPGFQYQEDLKVTIASLFVSFSSAKEMLSINSSLSNKLSGRICHFTFPSILWPYSTEINSLEQKKEINTQPEENEEKGIQKNKERLRNFQDNFKRSNIQIVGVPEGEEEQQAIENLFEKIMKDNFPIWQRK